MTVGNDEETRKSQKVVKEPIQPSQRHFIIVVIILSQGALNGRMNGLVD